jgi:hypothetical protein
MGDIDSKNGSTPSGLGKKEEILRAARVLFEPGQLVEVRLKGRDGHIASRYYNDHERMAAVLAKEDAKERWAAAWWSLQQLRPNAHAGKQKGETTKRADVEAYRWLVIDVDRADKSSRKLNATPAEKEQLLAVAKKVMTWLAQQGVQNCILADSGNGYHVLIKLAPLAANEKNYELLREVLAAVKHEFRAQAQTAEIDTSLAEPEQVIKAYGTTTRKSESTSGRPWQESKLLDVPKTIEPVKEDVLLAIAAVAPLPETPQRAPRERRALDPEFDPYDFFDHYGDAFGIEREFEKNGKTYFVTDTCVLAGHKHTGSGLTGFVLGDSFGYHCFSDECEGLGIGDVLRKLNATHGSYGKTIWIEPGRATAINEEDYVKPADTPEPAEDGKPIECASETEVRGSDEPGTNRAGSPGDLPADPEVQATKPAGAADQLSVVLDVVFRDPKVAHGDFVVWRNRLQWIVDERAWPKLRFPLLEKLLEYERAHRRLPTRGEFIDACGPELAGLVGAADATAADITLDHAVSALLDRAEYLDEKRTLKVAAERLDQHGIAGERKFQRERWARGVSLETTRVDGSIQDHADEIFDRMSAVGLGTREKSALSFLTPFPSINEAIMSDQERCFAVIGPPNNFKTSVLLSQAYYLAKQGKPVLFVTGEHDVEKLEEKITLLHGFFHRDRFALPPYKKWADGKVSPTDVANLRAVMDDWKSLIGVPGPLVVKHIQDFGNDLDRIVSWMESTHRKYGWRALMIDPFMELLLYVEDKEKLAL